MIASIDELRPDARAAAQRFLDASVADVERGLRDDVRAELTADLCERLAATATPADVAAIADGLAPEGGPGGRRPGDRWVAGLRLRGMLTRIAQTWWQPADQRLFLPRAVGLGWDVNLGAVAVRLNLIEPDAEAVPFTSTPDAAFRAAVALPALLAGATALHYLVRGRTLPQRLPSHWGPAGRPDRWVSKERAAATDIALTAGAVALAAWSAGSDRPGPTRAGAMAAATASATLGACMTVIRPTRGGAWVPVTLLGALDAGVGGVLLGLARAGRQAEIDRDLGDR